MKRPTQVDVARLANVSTATVSYVVNGRADGQVSISEETWQRVLQAVAELGYEPDARAQSLARGRTQTIAFVFSRVYPQTVGDLAHFQILEGLMTVAQQANVQLLVDSIREFDSTDTYLSLARTKRIDGLILSDPRLDDQALQELINDDFPLVLLGRLPDTQVCSLEFDNQGGARMAVEHLLAQGHTRIGLITYAPLIFTGAAERLHGYQEALAAAGIAFDETLVCHGDFSPNSGFTATMSLLAAPDAPTAIFAAGDDIAFGALAAINQRGLTVPDDVAVVGFDDSPFAPFTVPPLTTVRISFKEMGQQAGRLLLERILHDVKPRPQVQLGAELIVRASSIQNRSVQS